VKFEQKNMNIWYSIYEILMDRDNY
jgi:hypothetical protein